VVVLGQEESRVFKHTEIGTMHLLLGLLREEEGLAAHVLESLDITVERIRAQTVRYSGTGSDWPSGQIPFTPRAKKVLQLALREALSLGHNYIGTEHILLGLVREGQSPNTEESHATDVGYEALRDFDADAEKIRNEVIRMLSGPAGRRPSPPATVPRIKTPAELIIPLDDESTQVTWSGKCIKSVGQPGDKVRINEATLEDGRVEVTTEYYTPESSDSAEQ
jgi:ATP-dependent Clp protease ATP-binding subunit ClpC